MDELVKAAEKVLEAWDNGMLRVREPFWDSETPKRMVELREAVRTAQMERQWERA